MSYCICKFEHIKIAYIVLLKGYYTFNAEVLKVSGTDKQDFLNRISTNSLEYFPVLTHSRTIFLNDKGKIIDFCVIINNDTDFLLLCTKGNGKKLKEHIQKYIVNEDVEVEFEEYSEHYLIGINLTDIDLLDQKVYLKDNSIILEDNFRFSKIISLENKDLESAYLKKIKEETNLICENDFRVFCIEKLYLDNSEELIGYNPLECGLKEYISFNKGCYIGQEVISRMDSQQKIPKTIISIKSIHEIFKGNKIFNEAKEECGFITSTVKMNYYFGFAYIKSNFLKHKEKFFVNGKEIFINNLNS